MTMLQRFLRQFRKPPVIKTVIQGEEMQVSEWARLQAAINMRNDYEKRSEIERLIGVELAHQRYPEAYE